MSIWVDKTYTNMLQPRLDMFKVKKQSPYLANCRCPYCLDSDKNKFRTRGYFKEWQGKIVFYCHNCGTSLPIGKVLSDLAPVLHDEWLLESLKDSGGSFRSTRYITSNVASSLPANRVPKVTVKAKNVMGSLKKISQLDPLHPAREYVVDRKIPSEFHYLLYYAPKFAKWANEIKPGAIKITKYDAPRLVIPLLSKNGELLGFQGRSLNPNDSLRYITIMMDENNPKVFGFDRLDDSADDIWIVEGPLDSLFMPKNTIAMVGSDVNPSYFLDNAKSKVIFVYDNEPRSITIVNKIEKSIQSGYRVVIFPDNLIKFKDINDMILGGKEQEELSNILHRNIYSGLSATLRFNQWRKV